MSTEKRNRFNPYKKFNGILIPEAIVSLPVRTLSQGAKVAYGRLKRYSGADGMAYPKRETLAREIGCGVRQTDLYLNELRKFGLIETERPGLGKPNRYYFLEHEILDDTERNVDQIERDIARLEKKYGAVHSIKENQHNMSHKEKIHKEEKETASADNTSFSVQRNDVKEVCRYYRERICRTARLDDLAYLAVVERLQQYSLEELKEVIDGFSGDKWFMSRHRYQGINWFFKEDTNMEQWLNADSAEYQRKKVVQV